MQQEIDVKSLRTTAGLSQKEFAEIFGVDQTTVCHWEKKGVPTRGTTRKMLLQFAMFGATFAVGDRRK